MTQNGGISKHNTLPLRIRVEMENLSNEQHAAAKGKHEPPCVPKDATTSYKRTPLSRLPSVRAFGSEPFIQGTTLFKRKTDCTSDLPPHTRWNNNIILLSGSASASKYARRDTRPSDAKALSDRNTPAKRKRVQWKTPERDFTAESSLSAISKQDCFNSADTAYKPQKEALAVQQQDERLSSSTFHELLQSSWMSANLHCSMLNLNATEHAACFVEPQMSNFSVSALAIPVVTESKKHSYFPRDIKRQPRDEQFQCCTTRFNCSQVPGVFMHNKSHQKNGEDLVRDVKSDSNKLPFDMPKEIHTLELQERLNQMNPQVIHKKEMKHHMQTRVFLRRACKHEQASVDGQQSDQQHLTFVKCKTIAATEAQISAKLDVAAEASDDFCEKKIEERCEDLYRFRLQLRCLRMWSKRVRLLSQARCHNRRRILSKALYILRWAVKMHCAQTEAVERRRSTSLLCQSYYQWKNRYESRHIHNGCNTDALRRRLIQPSGTLLLMTAFSSRRSLHVLRAAAILNHLSLLYKHWLLWRQVCLRHISRRQQELWACVWWDRRLQSKAWTLWVLTLQRKRLVTHQYSLHLLATTWTRWKTISTRQKKMENLIQLNQMTILLHCFHHWQKRAEYHQKEREKQLSRRTLHTWHCYVRKTKLTHLSARASWELSRWMLAVNFRKWRNVTRRMQDTRAGLERVRHLQDKGRMQTAFTMWRQSVIVRMEIKKARENLRKAKLSRSLSAWRSVVERSALLLRCCHHRKTQTLKTCFQQWSRSLQLHRLLKEFLTHRLYTRLRNTGHGLIVDRMKKRFNRKTHVSAEELSAMLLLHNTFQKWTEISQKQQLSQSVHDRSVQRAALLRWYRLTVFPDDVLLFRARLAQLHPSDLLMSTSMSQDVLAQCENGMAEEVILEQSVLGHRVQHCPLQAVESQHNQMTWSTTVEGRSLLSVSSQISEEYEDTGDEQITHSCKLKAVFLRALGRMMHPDLSLAFSHWWSVARINRDMRLQADLYRISRGQKELAVRFGMWRANAQMHCMAVHHWDCEQLKCAFKWMVSRTERHRLNMSFSTWVTRANQQQTVRAVYIRTLQNRVFLAWQRYVQVCQQRQESAQFYSHFKLMQVCFCQWRIIYVQQQLASSKAQHTLHLRAKVILQHWRTHAKYRAHRQTVLWDYNERKKVVMKRRTFLIWRQTAEYFRRAQQYHQRALQYRSFSQWLHAFRHQSELLFLSKALDENRMRMLQWRAFSLWQLKLSRVHTHMQHISSLILRWRDTRHLRLHLCVWRERLVERKRTRVVVHRWKRQVSRVRKQRNIMRRTFLLWKAAFRQSLRSRDHWTHTQKRRVVLAWNRHTVSAQTLRYREACFQYSSEVRLEAAVFIQWRSALIQGQQRICAMERLTYQSRVSARAFQHWRTAAMECKANKTCNNRLLHKCFSRWTHTKDLLKAKDKFCVKKRRNEARLVLRTWSLWVKERKAQRQMEEAVSLWLQGRVVSRTFQDWVSMCQQYQKATHHRQSQLTHSMRGVEKKEIHGLTHLYWTIWKNQTEASLLYTQKYECSMLQKAWLTWRKRCIRNRVSADHLNNFNSVLLAQALQVWWQRAHGSDLDH